MPRRPTTRDLQIAERMRLNSKLLKLLNRTDLSAEEKRQQGQRMVREANFKFLRISEGRRR
jgi:hypothetical protein